MVLYRLEGGLEMLTSKNWTWTISWAAYKVWYILPSIQVHFPNDWLHWWHFEFAWLCVQFTIEKRYPRNKAN
jgi:hypothetical protein